MQAGYPIAVIRHEDRAAYCDALARAHAARIKPFLLLVADPVHRTIDTFLSATEEA